MPPGQWLGYLFSNLLDQFDTYTIREQTPAKPKSMGIELPPLRAMAYPDNPRLINKLANESYRLHFRKVTKCRNLIISR